MHRSDAYVLTEKLPPARRTIAASAYQTSGHAATKQSGFSWVAKSVASLTRNDGSFF